MNQSVPPVVGRNNPTFVAMAEAVAHDPAADMLDLRAGWEQIVQALVYRWRLILAVTAATVAILLVYIVVWPPTYQAHVTLIAASEKDADRDSFYSTWAVFRRNAVEDEVLLFGSGPVLAEVIDKQKLTYDDVYHPPLRYAVHLWTISPPGKAWKALKGFVFGTSPNALTPEQIDYAKTIDDFRTGVGVEQIASSNVGMLVVRASTPRVHEIANSVANTYLRQRREVFAAEAREAYASLKVETDKAYAELRDVERQMQQYYTENDMLLMFEKDKVEIAQYLAMRDQQMAARRKVATTRTELAEIGGMLSNEPTEVLSARQIQRSPVFAAYEQQLGQLEMQRELISLNYRPDSPEVITLNQQIDKIRQQMGKIEAERTEISNVVRSPAYETLGSRRKQLRGELVAAQAELQVLNDQVATLNSNIGGIPEKMRLSHNLGRTHSALEKKYMVLEERLMTAEVSAAVAASAPSTFRVVEWATPPEKPVSPRTNLTLLAGLVLGLVMGTALAILLNLVTGRVTASRLLRRSGNAKLYALVRSAPGQSLSMFVKA